MINRSRNFGLAAAAGLLLLAACAARAQDKGLTGVWILSHPERTGAAQEEGIAGILPLADPPLTDKARADLKKQRDASFIMAKQRCLPVGVPRMMVNELPIEIIEGTDRIAVIGEQSALARTIYLNSDASALNGEPTWNGISYGKWVNGELVVQVGGFNGRIAHILNGPAGSAATHIEEHYKILDGGKAMTITMTFTDPQVLTKPYTITYRYERQPPVAQRWEYVCDVDDPSWAGALGFERGRDTPELLTK